MAQSRAPATAGNAKRPIRTAQSRARKGRIAPCFGDHGQKVTRRDASSPIRTLNAPPMRTMAVMVICSGCQTSAPVAINLRPAYSRNGVAPVWCKQGLPWPGRCVIVGRLAADKG